MGERRLKGFDLFCGAGGSSWGAHLAGVTVVGSVDRDQNAIANFRANFPDSTAWHQAAENVDLSDVVSKVGSVDILLASPDCTNHTPARGNRRTLEVSKRTAFQVIRYAKALNPRWIVIENVISMTRWKSYGDFLNKLRRNYFLSELKLNSADFGVPQARRRLFILCDRDAEPPSHIGPNPGIRRNATDAVSLNGSYSFSPLVTPGRARATLERADRALQALGDDMPFLLVYYGSDGSGGWQKLDAPLRTITTVDRFALVKPGGNGHMMRMLQVPELMTAMGFTTVQQHQRFKLECGTRRDKIRLLGNAVCPPVMRAIVSALCRLGPGQTLAS